MVESLQDRIQKINDRRRAYVCVGLDIDPERFPAGISSDIAGAETFLRAIIDATAQHAAAYKPNLAFFLALGVEGYLLLSRLRDFLPHDTILIGDAKWGDIGNTAAMYAHTAFHQFHFDAVTLNPYQGFDAIQPFLTDPARGAFILCRTSNPSSPELQGTGENSLFMRVARFATSWNLHHNCGLVVGATDPRELGLVHRQAPNLPLLIPGIGAQGGDLQACMDQLNDPPPAGLLINSSRGILYAADGSDYARHSTRAAAALNESILDSLN